MLKALFSPLQHLAGPSKPVPAQDWRLLPDGQPESASPMTRPALASQLSPPAHKAVKPVDIWALLKPAAQHPPRDAAAITSMFVQIAAGGGSRLSKQHTTSPGWRALVRVLNSEVDPKSFSAEQAVSLITAAGLIGPALPAGTIPPQLSFQLIITVDNANSRFRASDCARFMQGLSVVKVAKKAWPAAAEAVLGPWLAAYIHRAPKHQLRYPEEVLGVLDACVRHDARPRGEYLKQGALIGAVCRENVLNFDIQVKLSHLSQLTRVFDLLRPTPGQLTKCALAEQCAISRVLVQIRVRSTHVLCDQLARKGMAPLLHCCP